MNLLCKRVLKTMVTRPICTTNLIYKRRKTSEEKKSPKIIEYSPKKLKNEYGVVNVWRRMSVDDLANSLTRSLDDVQEVMLYVDGTHNIEPQAKLEDLKLIQEIVKKCGMKSRVIAAPEKKITNDLKDRDAMPQPPAPIENLKTRPAVVTVMGHVDHGKTTLLDSLRGSCVAAGEAGGITQHIGAFTVILESGDKLTFLDTPGHAAFSAMRARGVNITDIIVLVVAAEDGVMAQTKEVITLAQSFSVPVIIAINKIDKPEADIEKTKRDLIQMGLALEENGGDIQVVPISALKGTNLQLLTDTICTQATLMNLAADPTGFVEGIVVESKTDPRRGKLSTAIVTRGTLRKGSILVSGLAHAKVRGLFDDNGKPIESALPGTPVEIIGWRELPLSGDIILEVESEKKAHSVIRWREGETQKEKAKEDLVEIRKKEEEHLEKYRKERDARRMAGRFKLRQGQRSKESKSDSSIPHVNIILKGDVHGSIEAILDVLETYTGNERCQLNVIHYGVGNITEGDVELAKAFNAIIYAFSLKSFSKESNEIIVRRFDVIYHLINDLKEVISSKLAPIEVEDIIGEAIVLQQFLITDGRKSIPVAGCRCTKGFLRKTYKFRLIRNNDIIYEGSVESLRHLKNEVDTIKKDVECGVRLMDAKVTPQAGDIVVCYTTHMETQNTDWDPGF